MMIKLIDNIEELISFVKNKKNIGHAVENDSDYIFKPSEFYIGSYINNELVGFFSVEFIRSALLEIHPVFSPRWRGKHAINATKMLAQWLIENIQFSTIITYVPAYAKQGCITCYLAGMQRVGIIKNALTHKDKRVDMIMYQVTKEELINGR